jgi:amino acid permease
MIRAAFASAPSATIPAAFYTILMAVIFGYYFLLIGKTCKLASAATYREVWEKTMGNKMSAAVATVNMLKPALANLAYSMILADTFKSLFEAIGFYFTRTSVLLFITVVALLPLCLLKNLKVLAPFSILGSLGMILTAFAMGVRYFDGTYDPDRSGKFLQELPDRFHPSFGTTGAQGAWSPQVMVLVCMLFEAYVAHYNAPRFIIELENNTVARFGKVVSWAFGASCAIYVMMTTFGFLTFGTASDGYILNNYATNDPLASICRVAIAFAILFTYPVVFMGFRDGVFDLLPIPSARETSHLLNVMTVSLLTILTFVAVFFDNLGVLNAVGGGTIATAIVFVFPSLFYRKAIHDHYKGTPPQSIRLEVMLVMILMWIGIAMGAVGVYMAIADLQRTHHGDATLEDGTASAGEPADASS